MRGGRARDEHRAAVARRLALLGDEVAMLREPSGEPSGHTRVRPAAGHSWPGDSWPGESSPGEWESEASEPAQSEPATSWVRESWPPEPDEPSTVRQSPSPALLPPGRHAARRRRWPAGREQRSRGLAVRELAGRELAGRELAGRELGGRGLLGPAQLTVVAVVAALGLAVTCWWLLRSGSEPVPLAAQDAPALVTPAAGPGAVPGSPASGSPAGGLPATGSGAAGQPEPASLVVDVAGKVRRPGIAVLEPGARVVDAIEAAGGARRGVDLSSLNLARLLVDGEQILVGVPGGPQPAPAGDAAGGALLVNLNTAGQAELETLPEVGPVTAQAIMTWREQHGGFSSVDQLVEVDGIGEATLATVSPFVTV